MVIKALDQVVGDWRYYVWDYDGVPIQQVLIYFFNGTLLIMDYEDFMLISDDEGF